MALVAALALTGCGAGPTQVPGSTAPTTTTTTARPPADPLAWANGYCGGYWLMYESALALSRQDRADLVALRDAAVKYETTTVTSFRFIATEAEKLGPLGPDVERLDERLVVALRKSADKHERIGTKARALPADAKFWTTYEQLKAQEFTEVADDEVDSLAKDIGKKYPAAFDDSPVCADVTAAAK